MVVHPAHPLAELRSVSFEETIDHEHVDILARSIMTATQRTAAAALGKQMRYRIQVSTVDAAYRIVAAQLALAIVPREEARTIQQALQLKVIPLQDSWAKRQFVISVRDTGLSLPAQLLVQSLRDSVGHFVRHTCELSARLPDNMVQDAGPPKLKSVVFSSVSATMYECQRRYRPASPTIHNLSFCESLV